MCSLARLFGSVEPAWNDRNLRELSGHIARDSSSRTSERRRGRPSSRRTATHSATAACCGCITAIAGFHDVKRELMLAVEPSLYSDVEGSTDSEAFVVLALTLGLEDDPPGAVERAVGVIEDVGRRNGIEHPNQMTVATSDGETLWGFRYSSEGKSLALLQHEGRHAPRAVPGQPGTPWPLRRDEARGLRAAWRPRRRVNEVAESSYGVIQAGQDELRPFKPRPPA